MWRQKDSERGFFLLRVSPSLLFQSPPLSPSSKLRFSGSERDPPPLHPQFCSTPGKSRKVRCCSLFEDAAFWSIYFLRKIIRCDEMGENAVQFFFLKKYLFSLFCLSPTYLPSPPPHYFGISGPSFFPLTQFSPVLLRLLLHLLNCVSFSPLRCPKKDDKTPTQCFFLHYLEGIFFGKTEVKP